MIQIIQYYVEGPNTHCDAHVIQYYVAGFDTRVIQYYMAGPNTPCDTVVIQYYVANPHTLYFIVWYTCDTIWGGKPGVPRVIFGTNGIKICFGGIVLFIHEI